MTQCVKLILMDVKTLNSQGCPICKAKKFRFNGHYWRKRNRRKVQRYMCGNCNFTCSDQSFNMTYRQKRPELLDPIMRTINSGIGVRRNAIAVRTSVRTYQRKVKFLTMICEAFQEKHMPNWKVRPTFQFDEMWSCEGKRSNTLSIPLVVETKSYFIVSAQAAHTHSLLSIPSNRIANNAARMDKILERDDIIKETLSVCSIMKPKGRIDMETDKKFVYMKFLKDLFAERLKHTRWDSEDPDEKNKLFPVNNTMACMRAEKSMFRRESWYITKDISWMNRHLSIYTVFYNYFRKKKYTETREEVVLTNPSTGEKITKVFKTYSHQTPAMKLGIFDNPITFDFLIKNCGLVAYQG